MMTIQPLSMLYLHGGGYVLGSAQALTNKCRADRRTRRC